MNRKSIEWNCPGWIDILTKVIITSIGFILINTIFFNYLYDIREYIESHNYFFRGIEYLAIVGFLLLFYAGPKILIGLFAKVFPQKNCDKNIYYFISLLLITIYVGTIQLVLFYLFEPLRGEEASMLRWDVLWWFVSLFIINIVFMWDEFRSWVRNGLEIIINYFNDKMLKRHLNE
jgi:hypothetical protein